MSIQTCQEYKGWEVCDCVCVYLCVCSSSGGGNGGGDSGREELPKQGCQPANKQHLKLRNQELLL